LRKAGRNPIEWRAAARQEAFPRLSVLRAGSRYSVEKPLGWPLCCLWNVAVGPNSCALLPGVLPMLAITNCLDAGIRAHSRLRHSCRRGHSSSCWHCPLVQCSWRTKRCCLKTNNLAKAMRPSLKSCRSVGSQNETDCRNSRCVPRSFLH